MALSQYKKKRKFSSTPEPSSLRRSPSRESNAKRKAKGGRPLIFVVQRHKATRLHYDFRLEMEGVLKSWAVPKGPSMNPSDKRLAMMVEDHPFDYKDFEGVIPEGNYGAGIVEIWDSGTLTDIEGSPARESEKNLLAALKKGDLKFTLKGKKLRGEFVLVRMRKAGENAWLLIKHRDEYALDESYDSETHTPKGSPINKWLAAKKINTGENSGSKAEAKTSTRTIVASKRPKKRQENAGVRKPDSKGSKRISSSDSQQTKPKPRKRAAKAT
jgi:bifunctional non-homologous end joining protein LigD